MTLDEAKLELRAISATLELENPQHVAHRVTAVPIMDLFVGSVRPALVVLLAAVALVLLIACANVANLLLSRATDRGREVAVRTALGASRGRIVAQFLSESLVLAIASGMLGLAMAFVGTRVFSALESSQLPRAALVTIDGTVLAFTLGTATLTALLFGLMPALHASDSNLLDNLRDGSRSATEGRSRRRIRKLLVVGEVALSVVLLVAAGLLLETFKNLSQVDKGFEPGSVLTMTLSPPHATHPGHADVTRYYRAIIERVQAVPGVVLASAVSFLPMSGHYDGEAVTRDDLPPPEPGETQGAEARAVTPDYFRTMGMTLLEGRALTAADDSTAPAVAIINRELASRLFPGEDPLGKRITMVRISREIVGVVSDVRQFGVQENIKPTLYAPHPQPFVSYIRREMSLALRTDRDLEHLIASVRAAVRQVDSRVPITEIQSLETLVSRDIARPRFRAVLLAIFAGIALFLAAVGTAGVMAYSVAQRRNELGIRMALGADRRAIVSLVMRDALGLLGLGIALGMGGALATTRLLSGLLYQVAPNDPATLLLVPVVLVAAASLAVLVPAWRAGQIDPVEAFRE